MTIVNQSRWRTPVLTAACFALLFAFADRPRAVSSNVIISQIYDGGGNSGAVYTNDFVELFNRGAAAVSLNGMSIQYASATGGGAFGANSAQITELPNVTLAAGQYLLIQEASGGMVAPLPDPDVIDATPINMSPTGGKVALVSGVTSLGCNGGSSVCNSTQLARIIDLVGYGAGSGTVPNFYEGAPAPAPSNSTAVIRNAGGCAETDNNAADFAVGAPTPRNSTSELHVCSVSIPTPPSGSGTATPPSLGAGQPVTLAVSVIPGANPASTGLSVQADLSAIGGGAAQPFFDDGTHGDVIASDNTFTFLATIAASVGPGAKSIPATILDAQGRSATASIPVTVEQPPVAIHDIQGAGDASPLVGQPVTTSGIVTAVKVSGSKGLFIQASDAEADANPLTSEGLFVYTAGAVQPAVGDLVSVSGTVQDYGSTPGRTLTEISGSPTVVVRSSGNPLPAPVLWTVPASSGGSSVDWRERYEGMRVQFQSLTVVGPTGGTVSEANATATSDGVFVGVLPGTPRPFREPGIEDGVTLPAGSPAGIPRFDLNLERLVVNSVVQSGGTPLDVPAGAQLGGVVGPLDSVNGVFTLLLDPNAQVSVTLPPGVGSAVAVPVPDGGQFTVAGFNMERFYDATNDPVGDVVLTPDAFGTRLNKASLAIRHVLRAPDILGVAEVEDLKTLDAVAAKVNADAVAAGEPDPDYVARLLEGNDVGLIDVGFLVKQALVGEKPRVSIVDLVQIGKDTTYVNADTGNIEMLNDRPSLVLRAQVADTRGGPAFPVTVIVNHLRSLSGIDTDLHVRDKRRLQSEQLALDVQRRQLAGERVVLVGDFNAFEFSDGYVDVMGTILGSPAPANQVVLATADVVDPNLINLTDRAPADQKYSYVFDGNAQQLDHVVVTSNLLPRVDAYSVARLGADFPEIVRNDGNRPERLSDHDAPVAYFSFPTADLSVVQNQSPNPVISGSKITYSVTVDNSADDPAVGLRMQDALPAGATLDSFTSPQGWTCTPFSNGLACDAANMASRSTATFSIVARVDCDLADGAKLVNQVDIDAATYDPHPSNNTTSVTATVSNPPPALKGALAAPASLWPVNHKMVPITIDYSATDNCDSEPVCRLSVGSSEPTDGRGDGSTATDWQVVSPHQLLLRAERAGTGSGRVYTVTIACSDSAGNVSRQSVTVTVPKNQK